MGGTIPPALSLTASSPDKDGNPTVTWIPPSGIVEGSVYFYRHSMQSGKDVPIPLNTPPVNVATGRASLLGLKPGDNSVFAVYYGDDGPSGQMRGYSKYSNDVSVHVFPISKATSVWTDQLSTYQIEVNWQNTTPIETGWIVERSIDNRDWERVQSVSQDATSWTDDLRQLSKSFPSSVRYRVIAKTPIGNSGPSPSASFTPTYGGPDITKNLQAIAKDFNSQITPWGAAKAARYLEDAIGIFSGQTFWDISTLIAGLTYPSSPAITALPLTCTVNGKVFDVYGPNYWLAGLVYTQMSPDEKSSFDTWCNRFTAMKVMIGDNQKEKLDWYAAGKVANVNQPQQPAKFSLVWPGKPYSRSLSWNVGAVLHGSD